MKENAQGMRSGQQLSAWIFGQPLPEEIKNKRRRKVEATLPRILKFARQALSVARAGSLVFNERMELSLDYQGRRQVGQHFTQEFLNADIIIVSCDDCPRKQELCVIQVLQEEWLAGM